MTLFQPTLLVEDRRAPNPRRVRIFMAEKGISVPTEQIDIMSGAHFGDHADRVGHFHVPALQLADGRWLTESVAICRFFEALVPEPNLMGRDGVEAAEIEMWQRRVEFELFLPISHVLRHENPKMAVLEEQVPPWAVANRARVGKALVSLDARVRDVPFMAGGRFTIADITAVVAVDFLRAIRMALPAECAALAAWHERMKARASYGA